MKAAVFLILIFFFVSVKNIAGQAVDWDWATSAKGKSSERAYCITTDALGNVYVAGMFNSDTAAFGSIKLVNHNASHYWNMFLAKYDAHGNILWATSANDSSGAYSLATDASGNVFVTGWFASRSVSFGSVVLVNNSRENFRNMFIVKYSSGGNVLWARNSSGAGHKYSNTSAADAAGNIYVAGYLYAYPWQEMFLMKYNSGGVLLWEKNIGTSNQANSIVTDSKGNVYVTGFFDGYHISFDSLTLTKNKIQGSSMFLVKFDSDGNVLWASQPGGRSFSEGSSIARDRFNNIYVTGYYTADTIFFGSNYFTSDNSQKMFLVKYNSNGDVVWAKSSVGACCSWGSSVATDIAGNIYAAGAFSGGNIAFDGVTIMNKSEMMSSFDDAVLVKYDNAGNLFWVTSINGNQTEEAYVTTDASGHPYVAGYFSGQSVAIGGITLNTTGNWDMFLARLTANDIMNDAIANNSAYEISADAQQNKLTVIFYMGVIAPPNLFSLYDLTGRFVMEKSFLAAVGKNEMEMDISRVPKGVYLLRVEGESGNETRRVIID